VQFKTELRTTVHMASRNPATFLGLAEEVGIIRSGWCANFALVDDALAVCGVWIDGRQRH
jgi:N-acetylglucosamine-6-phosphate deacetylase